MDKCRFRDSLIRLFPGFAGYWDEEDIYREEDRSFTAHGLLSAFFFFYRERHSRFDETAIRELAALMEKIVAADPFDESAVANAICTSFLEMLDEDREGRVLERHLGRECSEFLAAMRGYPAD